MTPGPKAANPDGPHALPGSEDSASPFLQGGGEMGSVIRRRDWEQTPLGAPDRWPQSLRSAVSICLGSAFPIAIYWGPDLALLYNDAWSPIPGAKHPWAVGRPAREVWPEIWDTIGPLFQQVVTTGEATRSKDQLLAMRRHGYTEECYFDYTFSPIRGESGQVEGIFNAVLETTERVIGERRLRVVRELAGRVAEARTVPLACQIASETLSSATADLPFALFYLISDDGQEAVLGGLASLDAGAAASPRTISLSETNAPAEVWPVARVVQTGAAELVENLQQRLPALPGGPWPEAADSALLLPVSRAGSARPYGVLVAGISPRRALDNDYRAFLDIVAGNIAQALANAEAYAAERQRAEALAEIDRAKTTFFSNVSHEFRTPLTLMLGPLEELLARKTDLPPSVADLAAMTHRNGLRLQKLVNSLLDFSRMEAGRARASCEPTDLAALTAEIASTFRSAIEKAGLQLTVDCPPLPEPVYVDREMWEKVVLNLLSNALKYTFEGSIAVRLTAQDGQARVAVEDSGTGIPPHDLPHLFERFHRVEGARGRTQEGTGIGLALVAELVKLHGGTVDVRSTFGKGSTFIVSLPFGTAHLPPNAMGAAPKHNSTALHADAFMEEASRWLPDRSAIAAPPARNRVSGSRVLVADDNADMRDYVTRLLDGRYEVETVANGNEALERILANPPDLVLSDVMMPGLDGFGLLQAVRANPKTRALPVVLLSARAGEEARAEGLDAGATDYLVKPFTTRELLARVGAHLEMARVREQAAAQEAAFRAEAEQARDQATGILESIQDGFFTLDRNWCFTYVNPAGEQLLGATNLQLQGRNYWELYPSPVEEHEYRRAVRDRVPVEFEIADNARARWFAVKTYPTGQGGLSVYMREITERKEAETKLRESQERIRRQWHTFDTALSHTPDFIYTFDREGRFTYVNRALLSFWQKSIEEALGKNLFELDYSRELASRLHHQIQEVVETRSPVRDSTPFTGPNGETREYEYIFVPVFAADGSVEAVAGSTRDVTDRKRAEEQERERQAQFFDAARLESLGIMAGGIAHDFNNLLVGILGNASLLVETVSPADRQFADGIVSAAERAAELTRQMLAYSGKGRFVIEVLDLNHLIHENLTLLRTSLSRTVTVGLELGDEPYLVEVDRTQLNQVVMNLLINASEAIGDRPGSVVLRTTLAERESEQWSNCLRSSVPAGTYALLEVQDNGIGMTAETLNKIFDPFFTTKFTGRGLGLAAVLGIIKGHRGDIQVESRPGAGTTFRIWLPVSERADSRRRAPASASAVPVRPMVLVVDDEAIVRNTAAAALERGGFRTLLATDGKEALELLRTEAAISLVILDLTMPVMTGEQALPLIKALRPEIPIILSSGFNEAEIERRFASAGIAGVLQKPYTLSAIKSKVTQILSSTRSG